MCATDRTRRGIKLSNRIALLLCADLYTSIAEITQLLAGIFKYQLA